MMASRGPGCALNKDVTLAPVEERQEIGDVVGGHEGTTRAASPGDGSRT
jgi:hypothetical protein